MLGGGYGISIPVALKTFRNNYKDDGERERLCDMSKTEFENEKKFFKQLIAKPKEYHEHIVKCFGMARIDNKEYIVTEDLTKQNFISIKQLKEKSEIFNINKKQLKKINTQFKQLGNHLEKYKIRHGDIHDGNLMINLEQCIIKMIDFGGGKVDYDMRPRLDLETLIFFNKKFNETFNVDKSSVGCCTIV